MHILKVHLDLLNPQHHETLGLARNPDLRTFADICVLLRGICVLLRGWLHLKKSEKTQYVYSGLKSRWTRAHLQP